MNMLKNNPKIDRNYNNNLRVNDKLILRKLEIKMINCKVNYLSLSSEMQIQHYQKL